VNKVFFMPFDPNALSYAKSFKDYGDGIEGGGALKIDVDHQADKMNGKAIVVVWYQPGKKNAFLQSMNSGQVYVRGHGTAGLDEIESTGGGEKVDSSTVADRLIKSGLPKIYNGKIKFFNCHSAEQGANGETPFAQRAANELYARGYKNCTYWGYDGPIDRNVKDGPAGKHHYRREFVKGKDGNSVQQPLGRAKENRHQIFPQVKPGFFAKLGLLISKK
jgi:hypothetical protein